MYDYWRFCDGRVCFVRSSRTPHSRSVLGDAALMIDGRDIEVENPRR